VGFNDSKVSGLRRGTQALFLLFVCPFVLIVENCRRRGINPHAYLRDVLTRLPTMKTGQIPEVTPEAWAKAQKQRSEPKAAA
jgi:hypothetical protein